MLHKDVVNDISEGCNEHYCPLEEMLHHSKIRIEGERCYGSGGNCAFKESVLRMPLDDRLLEQHKCVEMFKWEESERQKKDIGWREAWSLWMDKGYADAFSHVYREGMKHHALYEGVKRVVQSVKSQFVTEWANA